MLRLATRASGLVAESLDFKKKSLICSIRCVMERNMSRLKFTDTLMRAMPLYVIFDSILPKHSKALFAANALWALYRAWEGCLTCRTLTTCERLTWVAGDRTGTLAAVCTHFLLQFTVHTLLTFQACACIGIRKGNRECISEQCAGTECGKNKIFLIHTNGVKEIRQSSEGYVTFTN